MMGHDNYARYRGRSATHGVALILVLGVIAAASILSWAMLSAAALRSELDLTHQDATQGKYLADSGVSYAMYYLRYPEKSPVALTTGPYNTYYGGQDGLVLWTDAPGKVNVVVSNTALNTYVIRSSAIVNGLPMTSEAEVYTPTTGYKVQTVASFGGPITLPSSVTVTGLVSTAGNVLSSTGTLLTSLGGSSITVSSSAVPRLADMVQITETGKKAPSGGDDRTYTIDGVSYVAEKAPETITGALVTSRPTLNPANVWYSDESVTLNGGTIAGTLILRDNSKSLDLQGTSTITAKSNKLPALIVAGDTRQKHQLTKAAKLTVNGVVWVGGKITTTGTSLAAGFFNINGSLLMGSTAPSIDSSQAPMSIQTTSSLASVRLTAEKTITGIVINRWTHL